MLSETGGDSAFDPGEAKVVQGAPVGCGRLFQPGHESRGLSLLAGCWGELCSLA